MKPQKDQGTQEGQGPTGSVCRLMALACPLQMLHSHCQVHNLQNIQELLTRERYVIL